MLVLVGVDCVQVGPWQGKIDPFHSQISTDSQNFHGACGTHGYLGNPAVSRLNLAEECWISESATLAVDSDVQQTTTTGIAIETQLQCSSR